MDTPPKSLDELNKKIHDLNYIADSKPAKSNVSPDSERGKELARKIKQNIEAYQNEVSTRRRPNVQAS